MGFKPTEEAADLLSALREGGLEWVAGEIEESIAIGKAVYTSGSGPEGYSTASSKTRAKVEEFTADEQVDLVLATVKAYSVELRSVSDYARTELKEVLGTSGKTKSGDDALDIQFVDADTETALTPFTDSADGVFARILGIEAELKALRGQGGQPEGSL